MPIQRNNNEETDLIIGNKFPTDNEETFAADATKQRLVAEKLRDLTDQITQTKEFLAENLSGSAVTAYVEKLADQEKKFQSAAETHDNLATGLEVAANNIAVTKSNMNSVDDTFHSNMDNLKQWGQESGQIQETMVAKRNELLDEARNDINRRSTELSSFKDQTISDLENERTVSSSHAMHLRDGAASTDIIASRGAGFVSPESTAGTFTSSNASTGLSSATTVTSRENTPVAGAGFMPAAPLGQGNAAQNQSQASAGVAGMPMMGTAAGAASGTAGAGAAAGSTSSSTTSRAQNLTTAPGDATRHASGARVEGVNEQWSEDQTDLVRVALTIFNDLAMSGWVTGVAVARIVDNGETKIVWTTDHLAALVPETTHTDKAVPANVTRVPESVVDAMVEKSATIAVNEYARAIGADIVEGVCVASEGPVSSRFINIKFNDVFSYPSDFIYDNAAIDSSQFIPHDLDKRELEQKARTLAEKAQYSVSEALLYATYANKNSNAGVMPDGTQLSATGYTREAIMTLISDSIESGSTNYIAALAWQESLLK